MRDNHAEISVELVTDGDELGAAQQQRERFDRNAAWLQEHAAEVYGRHRGQCICVAGGEVFVGHTAQEVVQAAAAARGERLGCTPRTTVGMLCLIRCVGNGSEQHHACHLTPAAIHRIHRLRK